MAGGLHRRQTRYGMFSAMQRPGRAPLERISCPKSGQNKDKVLQGVR